MMLASLHMDEEREEEIASAVALYGKMKDPLDVPASFDGCDLSEAYDPEWQSPTCATSISGHWLVTATQLATSENKKEDTAHNIAVPCFQARKHRHSVADASSSAPLNQVTNLPPPAKFPFDSEEESESTGTYNDKNETSEALSYRRRHRFLVGLQIQLAVSQKSLEK
mmetsp:Transcript_59614/g.158650  ORF Transcript_59614/g.158650 Transcript_59614/m.158650 type:complete len:168 (+) Transcript_59614:47-550(+)